MEERLQNELEHARYLLAHGAGQVWNWEGAAGRLRWQRRVRMLTEHLRPDMKVLELGCGTGYFTRELAKTGAKVTAIDISADLLEAACSNCRAANVEFEVQNAYALDYSANSFDSVVGSSVLHHLELSRAIAEIYRVLRPNGSMFFTEPNMLNPQIALQKNIPAIKKRLGDSPDETAFFRWRLKRWLAGAGFREITITPFDFLHPRTPERWIPVVERAGNLFEWLPVLREFAGSLYLHAIRGLNSAESIP